MKETGAPRRRGKTVDGAGTTREGLGQPAEDASGGSRESQALAFCRKEICEKNGHTHGEAGELECLKTTWARLIAEGRA